MTYETSYRKHKVVKLLVVSDCLRPCGLWPTQAPPSMRFSRQEYWRGLPFPSPGDLPDPGIEYSSPALQADTLTSEPPGQTPKSVVLKNKFILIQPADQKSKINSLD